MTSKDWRISADWEDDDRMTVMFSPFREKSLNPKGWEQKMKFWTELIQKCCIEWKLSMITVNELRERFKRKGKMPSCLQTVINEMIRVGAVKKLSDIETKSSEGWLSWGFNKLVREPVGWSLKILPWQQDGKKSNETEETFFVLEVLKKKANELMERHTGRLTDGHTSVIEYKELRKLHTDLCAKDTEFSLVLQHLQNTNQVVIQEVDKDKKLVKFIQEEQNKTKTVIEEKDIHIHKIQLAKESLKNQIKLMAREVDSLGKEAVSLKAQGHKSLAMSSMRKRKLAQNRIAKLTGSLDTLEEILFRIKQAESNEMVLRAIEGGTSILKGITSKTTAEEVEEIMENLADVSQSQDDLSAELSLRVGGDEPSMTELEDELNDIMADDGANRLDKLHSTFLDDKSVDKDNEFDAELEKELADILKEDSVERTDKFGNSSLSDMLDDLQLPDVPTHSPQKDQKPKKLPALFS